jgi:uncharacterized membrane protein YoaK (UPF0700 family)
MKPSVPDLLTFNGGYVDTAGFLTLQGLFTAHVTGNFVTLGATLVHGTSGALTKTLALPVFCVVVALSRTFSAHCSGELALNMLLGTKIALFIVAAVLAIAVGPFSDADTVGAVVTGMSLVAAMAIQNTVHRVFFSKSPPTTLMTGSTTQIMMDLADLLTGKLSPESRSAAVTRSAALFRSIWVFALGCGLAALSYSRLGAGVLLIPAVIAVMTFIPRLR